MNNQGNRKYVIPECKVRLIHLKGYILQASTNSESKVVHCETEETKEQTTNDLFTGKPLTNGGVWGDDEWD